MGFIVFNDGTNSGGGGGGVTTLNNGLTLTGTNGQLGGALVKGTNITLAGFPLAIFGNTNASLTLDDSSGDVQLTGGNANQGSLNINDSALNLQFAGTQTEVIIFDGSAMTVRDSLLQGFVNHADYSANTNPLRLVQHNELGGGSGGFVALNKVAGASSSQNLINYTIPESTPTQFVIFVSGVVRNTGTGSATIVLSYTDSEGGSQTFNLATGVTPGVAFGPGSIPIYCQNATNITIALTITGTGIFVDVASAVQFIQ